MSTDEPTLYDLAKEYVNAVEWDEEHADDAWGEAGVEYAEDELVAFVHERFHPPTGAQRYLSGRLADAEYAKSYMDARQAMIANRLAAVWDNDEDAAYDEL